MKSDTPKTARAHIRYTNGMGAIVPSVTRVIGNLNKPQLVPWANRLGLQGIDSSKYRDDKASVGHLAHALVLADFTGSVVDTSEYTAAQIAQAETSYLQYLEWAKGKHLETIFAELPLVSETWQYGGTPDWYGYVDGELCGVDYKTGGIFREVVLQVSAYRELIRDNGYVAPSKFIVLGIPRSSDEIFREVTITDFTQGWAAFSALRALYDPLKQIKI